MAGALELFTVYLGERLGLYRALADGGSATSAELAARTGTTERYVPEWLEQQAASGLLTVGDPAMGRWSGGSRCLPGMFRCSPTLMTSGTGRSFDLDEAGFADVEVLPVEAGTFRFYLLTA